jgi:hypothetical protein
MTTGNGSIGMGILRSLLEIERVLDRCLIKGELLMAQLTDFQTLLTAIDIETTRIATKIAELVAKLAVGGLTQAEEAQVFADVTTHLDHLKSIGVATDKNIETTAE